MKTAPYLQRQFILSGFRKSKFIFWALLGIYTLIISPIIGNSQNSPPVLNNCAAFAHAGQNELTIYYDVEDAENDPITVFLRVSDDQGQTFLVDANAALGDVGLLSGPGTDKSIVWNYGIDHPNILDYQVKVVAKDDVEISIDQIVSNIDTTRLRSDLEWLQGYRNYDVDPARMEWVKDTLVAFFTEHQLQVRRQGFTSNGHTAENLIGRKPGCVDEGKTYIVDAHFDAVEVSPGADDNGSGVVGFMEILRVLSEYEFEKSLSFIGFDQEEEGLRGSYQYVLQPDGLQEYEDLQGVLNFEMIGFYTDEPNTQEVPANFDIGFPDAYATIEADSFRGNFIISVGNQNSTQLISDFQTLGNNYIPELKIISLEVPLNGMVAPDLRRSDHASFWDAGYPALMITDGANFRNTLYHTSNDEIDVLDFEFMGNVVRTAAATLAELAVPIHATSQILTVQEDPNSGIRHTTKPECEVHLYPNPIISDFVLEFSSCWKFPVQYEVIDMNGKTIQTGQSSTPKTTLNLNKLALGSYIIQLTDNNHTTRKEFIKTSK